MGIDVGVGWVTFELVWDTVWEIIGILILSLVMICFTSVWIEA